MTTEATAKTSEETEKTPEGKAKAAGTQTDTEDAPKFTQADLDRIAAKTRDEEREKARKAKEKEDREREELKAKEQGEFQKLADGYKKELDEVKPKLETAEAELKELRPAFAGLIEAELKTLPEEVVDSGPAKYEDNLLVNPLEVAAWLPKGKALADKLEGAPARPSAGRDPKAKGTTPGDLVAAERARLERNGKYAL